MTNKLQTPRHHRARTRSGRLAANRPCGLHDAGIAQTKLAQDAQPEPVAALPSLKLVFGQFGQRINQRVYRSIQFPNPAQK